MIEIFIIVTAYTILALIIYGMTIHDWYEQFDEYCVGPALFLAIMGPIGLFIILLSHESPLGFRLCKPKRYPPDNDRDPWPPSDKRHYY